MPKPVHFVDAWTFSQSGDHVVIDAACGRLPGDTTELIDIGPVGAPPQFLHRVQSVTCRDCLRELVSRAEHDLANSLAGATRDMETLNALRSLA